MPITRRPVRLVKGAAAVLIAAASGVVASPPSAGADGYVNPNFYGGVAGAEWGLSINNPVAGMFRIWNVAISRSILPWNQICDYQSDFSYSYNGTVFHDYSSFHSGCNFFGFPARFNHPSFGNNPVNGDAMPTPASFYPRWKDNHTGGEWRKIGGIGVNF